MITFSLDMVSTDRIGRRDRLPIHLAYMKFPVSILFTCCCIIVIWLMFLVYFLFRRILSSNPSAHDQLLFHRHLINPSLSLAATIAFTDTAILSSSSPLSTDTNRDTTRLQQRIQISPAISCRPRPNPKFGVKCDDALSFRLEFQVVIRFPPYHSRSSSSLQFKYQVLTIKRNLPSIKVQSRSSPDAISMATTV
ncbi:hypothetical protein BDQ12DRAFT_691930 [Crucibulum laeve]|uniref:Uncharacterized protein n=1 Tax=Crucibulum laeve TaxID=68775 RepID=A0A5C3LJU3_9AGAR|nr:hypothetical protein BDQ12DRAFT_691930 [Crucibulum laeve]